MNDKEEIILHTQIAKLQQEKADLEKALESACEELDEEINCPSGRYTTMSPKHQAEYFIEKARGERK